MQRLCTLKLMHSSHHPDLSRHWPLLLQLWLQGVDLDTCVPRCCSYVEGRPAGPESCHIGPHCMSTLLLAHHVATTSCSTSWNTCRSAR